MTTTDLGEPQMPAPEIAFARQDFDEVKVFDPEVLDQTAAYRGQAMNVLNRGPIMQKAPTEDDPFGGFPPALA